jgi:peptide/nickel transport system permease protein
VRGDSWKFLGIFETNWHLFGVDSATIEVATDPAPAGQASGADAEQTDDDPFAGLQRDDSGRFQIGVGTTESEEATATEAEADTPAEPVVTTETIPGFIHLLGTDELGRDGFSRLMHATRTSMTVGVAGLLTAFILGLVFGGIAGYFGGWIDYLIQRLIEIVRSIPTIPLVMALAAAFPRDWPNLRVFFFTSIILGFVGWTTLARRIRSMLLTLQDEEYVVAARLAGAKPARVIIRHMLPAFFSYIVVTLAIEFPYMILAESVLSFVGLGLRPPTVSWGVLLQEAQKIQVLEQTPWLLFPAVAVIVAILAFNFLGDGLRDAADPYQET